jgi:DNA (cytosine-5)-methyltransferase 1
MNVVDVFSGGGGFGLGFAMAGFRIRVAVEIDRDAVRTYSANHGGTVVLQEDVRNVDYTDLRKYAGISKSSSGALPASRLLPQTQTGWRTRRIGYM